jgi:hypothetical protein
MTPTERRVLAGIRAELARLVRYDDESVVHEKWIRQRYDCGCFPDFAAARTAAVKTAWHEAGHAVAALAVRARFSSASIHHGHRDEGRVRGIEDCDLAFVVHAAGQVAERLRTWTMLESDRELRDWLGAWRRDGGDATRFRRSAARQYGRDEAAAWRYSERVLTPLRTSIRELARALLVHPRHLSYHVAAEIAGVRPAADGTRLLPMDSR